MKRLLLLAVFLGLGACQQSHGDRCNALRATNDCEDPALTCVYPATPSCNPSEPGTNCCGVSFCCKVDANGNIIDTSPNCQPDHDSQLACGFDLNVVIQDGGSD